MQSTFTWCVHAFTKRNTDASSVAFLQLFVAFHFYLLKISETNNKFSDFFRTEEPVSFSVTF